MRIEIFTFFYLHLELKNNIKILQISNMEKSNETNTTEVAGLNIRKLFFYYLSHWKFFLLSILFFMAAGVFYLMKTVPEYEIKASVMIKDNQNQGQTSMSILEQFDFFSTRKIFENEIEILRSHTLMRQVVQDLNLQISFFVKEGLRTIPVYNEVPVKVDIIKESDALYATPFLISFNKQGRIVVNGKSYPQNALISEVFGCLNISVKDSLLHEWDKDKDLIMTIVPLEVATEQLRGSINIKATGKGSSILNLSMLTPLSTRGVDILNSLLKAYDLAEIADKNILIGTTLAFINNRLSGQEEELRKAELEVQEFKSAKGITDISEESKLYLEAIQKTDASKTQADIQLSVLRDIENYVLRESDNEGVVPATFGISDPALLQMITQLSNLEVEKRRQLRTLKPANPIILGYDDQIASLKRNIINNIRTLRSSLEITKRRLNVEGSRLEKVIQSIPKRERELVDVKRGQEIKNHIYSWLLSKREEAAISYASTVADSRIIDAAHSTMYPIVPVRKIVMLISLILGGGFPLLILWIKGLFSYKVKFREDVLKIISIPIVGEISQLSQATRIIHIERNRGIYSEQIRTLRTNLELMNPELSLRTVLVTSYICDEGKSFVAANLGAAFAATGKRTIIIDFDMNLSGLHDIAGVENIAGIYNYLAGNMSLSYLVQPVPEIDNLDIITCGQIQPNQGDLLHKHTLSNLKEELLKHYDYIIIDAPPIGLMSDARTLSQFVDISIFTIRHQFTPKIGLDLINRLTEDKQFPNLCLVVNGIEDKKWYGYVLQDTKKYYRKYETV